MPRYLTLCKYSPEAYKGLLKETPSSREKFIRGMYESNDAKLISMDWLSGGEYTVAVVSEGPRDALVAIGIAVGGSGALPDVRNFELMSSAEMDKALAGNKVSYRAAGQ